jgi:hypothetical protein
METVPETFATIVEECITISSGTDVDRIVRLCHEVKEISENYLISKRISREEKTIIDAVIRNVEGIEMFLTKWRDPSDPEHPILFSRTLWLDICYHVLGSSIFIGYSQDKERMKWIKNLSTLHRYYLFLLIKNDDRDTLEDEMIKLIDILGDSSNITISTRFDKDLSVIKVPRNMADMYMDLMIE